MSSIVQLSYFQRDPIAPVPYPCGRPAKNGDTSYHIIRYVINDTDRVVAALLLELRG